MSVKWKKVTVRLRELEGRQEILSSDYNGVAELIKEDIEEEDLPSLRKHVSDLEEIAQDLKMVRDEINHLCDVIDNACEEERMCR